jgi:NAD(P)-dependent dehydrogenase (short-subunit alcohol dehydrogenase family)
MNEAAGRIALITGANRGIGYEIARQLGRRGMHIIAAARTSARGEAAVERLQAEDIVASSALLDVNNEHSMDTLAASVTDDFGRLDVLVNNAGVYPDEGVPGLEVDLAIVRDTLETNTLGPLRLCQLFAPLMRTRSWGRVVNVSSGAGQMAGMTGTTLAYRVSKAALNAITLILADELRDTGILVNALCPGWVRTEMGGPGAPRSVERGADTAAWLATLPDDGPTGGLFRDRKPIPW